MDAGTFLIKLLKLLFWGYFINKGLNIFILYLKKTKKYPREKITITQKDNEVILRHSNEVDNEFWGEAVK